MYGDRLAHVLYFIQQALKVNVCNLSALQMDLHELLQLHLFTQSPEIFCYIHESGGKKNIDQQTNKKQTKHNKNKHGQEDCSKSLVPQL